MKKSKNDGFKVFLLAALLLISHEVMAESAVNDVLFISPFEVNEGRIIVNDNCASCHGLSGISDQPGVPHLAGQHADYLYLQLSLFQSGKRISGKSQHVFNAFKQDALKNAAIYYSVQDLFDNKKPIKKMSQVISSVKAGQLIAVQCERCHGKTGNGTFSGMPRLTGKHQNYLVSAISDYKNGRRKNAMMDAAVKSLSLVDIENLALFYAAQKPEGSKIKVNGNSESGRELVATCVACHGEFGHSPTPIIPSLAGQDSAYLIKAIKEYKNALRDHVEMRSAVEALTPDDINNIAAFFSLQTPKVVALKIPLTIVELVDKCDRCHGVNGNSQSRFIPSISGQKEGYLNSSLLNYKSMARANTMMSIMLAPLREVDINALAKHYSQKIRRSVIFVEENRR